MRDFDWFDELFAVVKEDGSFAGSPCTSLEEARELANQHENSRIYLMQYDNCNFEDEDYGYEDDVDETGYNPYLGCYDYDC